MPTPYPIDIDDVCAARERILRYLPPTPLRRYEELDAHAGSGLRIHVKHENHQPTNAFKVRNAISALTALSPQQRAAGVVCGTRGNHGLGVAFSAAQLGITATIVVPFGNNPEKNAGMRGLGARLIEFGDHYDEAAGESVRLSREEGMTLIHSTNNADVIAGAGTMTLEILEQAPELDAIVVAVGGGSQAVGAIVVTRALRPQVKVYAVQAEGAAAAHASWHAGKYVGPVSPSTIADGVATGDVYELTFPSLRAGLAGFVTVGDDEIIDATRMVMRTTHNLVEPSGAVGLAGLLRLRRDLTGKSVCVILSGGNIDQATLRRCVCDSAEVS
jgi:threonine dehydratase